MVLCCLFLVSVSITLFCSYLAMKNITIFSLPLIVLYEYCNTGNCRGKVSRNKALGQLTAHVLKGRKHFHNHRAFTVRIDLAIVLSNSRKNNTQLSRVMRKPTVLHMRKQRRRSASR